MNARRDHVLAAGFGLALGFVLSNLGFSSWTEVHRMFTLESWRLPMAFGGAVILGAVVFWASGRRQKLPPRPYHHGIVPGAALFGAGWAVCGSCPSIALVQLGEGKLAAIATVAGIGAGTLFYKRVVGPLLNIDVGSCEL